MVKKISTVTAALLLASALHADVLGGEFSVGYLNLNPSGDFAYKGNSADVEDNFGWGSSDSVILKGYFEHPLPVLPNLRVAYTNLDFSGSGIVTGLKFGDKTFSGKIDTALDVDIIDATLYYEILDNWVNLDLGLNAKYIDGTTWVKNSTLGKSEADLSVVLPTLYAKARFDIPMSGFSFQAEGDLITYNNSTLYDVDLGARYTFMLGLGVEAGVRMMKLKLDDVDDINADIDFSGAYISAVWDF